MKDIRFKGLKNTTRKQTRGIRRLSFATLGLLIVSIASLLIFSSVRVEAFVPFRDTFTLIEYAYNTIGVLIDKVVNSVTTGLNMLGQNFRVETRTEYRCTAEDGVTLLGKAYAESMTVTSTTSHTDGSWSETIDDITYIRDWDTGRLTGDGATGTRTSIFLRAGPRTSRT